MAGHPDIVGDSNVDMSRAAMSRYPRKLESPGGVICLHGSKGCQIRVIEGNGRNELIGEGVGVRKNEGELEIVVC